ncbi:unnamed protein product [Staurois parvus]|uniref:Uncharacterized protein n=1 Tax=Staurois parvus TaxID=386267 RepID=A0ABN9CJJ3_9NEOB|nr:unnamed protein product [Staurois parvus]
MQSHTKQWCLQLKALTQHTVKHHTVNPLITPHVNPFLSSVSTVSVITVLVSPEMSVTLGMSATPSQFPPVSECLLQFRSPAISH